MTNEQLAAQVASIPEDQALYVGKRIGVISSITVGKDKIDRKE
jgi:hypothetical protein